MLPENRISIANGLSEESSLFIRLLPYELVLKILDMLDFRALVICSQADSSALRYTIELGVSGTEDGPSGGLKPGDRLQRLLDYQKAWSDLKWTGDKTIPMGPGAGVWELAGGVLGQAIGRRSSLRFTQLPSNYRGIQEKCWVVDTKSFDLRDFTMDPSQDLLVLVERPRNPVHARRAPSDHQIRLLNMSIGAPHRAARVPDLDCSVPMSGDGVSVVIRICGDHLAILFKNLGERKCALRAWNWKTGRLQYALSGVGLRCFSFLDEKHIIVTTHIDLQSKGLQPNLVIYDISRAVEEDVALEESSYLCAFLLPVPGDWTVRLDIEIQSDPASSMVPDAALSVPFYTQRAERLNVVTITLTNGIEIQSYGFMIPSSTLSKHIASLHAQAENVHIPWDRWGPTGSRMIFEPKHSNIWVCHVYGLRYTTPEDMVDSDGATSIAVYDFNPLPIRRAHPLTNGSPETHVTEAAAIDTDGVFAKPITTSLPYRLSKVSWGPEEGATDFGRFGTVMCSEDGLVVVGVS
ncbi:hypothetical protein HWV62_6503 [Athelia sp. TMB]|nr:hypothetical protein HWV62_6503 [Athelia sp. TMB]